MADMTDLNNNKNETRLIQPNSSITITVDYETELIMKIRLRKKELEKVVLTKASAHQKNNKSTQYWKKLTKGYKSQQNWKKWGRLRTYNIEQKITTQK